MLDLDDIGVARGLARQIRRDIDAYCEATYADEWRSHLGASIIGHECARYIWYGFRWTFKSVFDGRMLRLFNRGHREEARFVEWLTGIGCLVSEGTDDGKQHRVTDVGGHFGGSLDSFTAFAERYQIKQRIVIGEFKTHNYKSFAAFKSGTSEEKSVKEVKPQHYAQMCVYGYKRGCTHGIYCAVNKNDDDLHIEIVRLDWAYAEDLIRKGNDIIVSKVAPRKIAATAEFHKCKWCDARNVCWHGADAEKNCRSCVKSTPIDDKQWFCEHFNAAIPEDYIKVGCDNWQSITAVNT